MILRILRMMRKKCFMQAAKYSTFKNSIMQNAEYDYGWNEIFES